MTASRVTHGGYTGAQAALSTLIHRPLVNRRNLEARAGAFCWNRGCYLGNLVLELNLNFDELHKRLGEALHIRRPPFLAPIRSQSPGGWNDSLPQNRHIGPFSPQS